MAGALPNPDIPGLSRWAFAKDVLTGLNAPVSDPNIVGMLAWQKAEGTAAKFNPYATTLKAKGSTDLAGNSAHVQEYPNWATGVAATVQTIGHYQAIVDVLQGSQDPQQLAVQVGRSGAWGSDQSLIASVASGWGNGHGGGVIQAIGYGGSAIPGAGGGDIGVSAITGAVTGVAGAAWGAFGAPISWGEAIAKFLGQLLDRNTWIRFGEILGGLALGVGGLIVLAKALGADSAVSSVAGKVAPIAALAA